VKNQPFKQFRRGIYYTYADDGTCHIWGNYYKYPSQSRLSVHKYVPAEGDVLTALLEMETHVAQLKASEEAKRVDDQLRTAAADVSQLMATEIAKSEERKRRAAARTERHRLRARSDVQTALDRLNIDLSLYAASKVYDYQNIYGDVATIPFMR